MKKKLYEYFKGIENDRPLPRVSGGYVEDGGDIRKFEKKCLSAYGNLFSYVMNGNLMCVKCDGEKFYQEKDLMEVVSGEYFNNSGVLSTIAYPVWLQEDSILGHGGDRLFGVATHDLNDIKEIDIISAKDVFSNLQRNVRGSEQDWEFTAEKRTVLLDVMTERCLDDYINLHLCDRLGGYIDRHGENFFYYREKGADKWQGVIAIDNGETMFVRDAIVNRLWGVVNDGGKSLLDKCYRYYSINGDESFASHRENIASINKAIQKGILNEKNLQAIKKALEFSFADHISKTCQAYHLNDHNLYDRASKLWEYNDNALET